jgi:hypothetical protein
MLVGGDLLLSVVRTKMLDQGRPAYPIVSPSLVRS